MYNYITKYASGGLIDTAAMREDLKKSSEFFKKGNYTNRGRKRLAAIQQIEDNQKQGLQYNIDENNQTFSIVDKAGKLVGETPGRGMSTDEGGLLYGALSRDKSARKEISLAIADAAKSGYTKSKDKSVTSSVQEDIDIDKDIDKNRTIDDVAKDDPEGLADWVRRNGYIKPQKETLVEKTDNSTIVESDNNTSSKLEGQKATTQSDGSPNSLGLEKPQSKSILNPSFEKYDHSPEAVEEYEKQYDKPVLEKNDHSIDAINKYENQKSKSSKPLNKDVGSSILSLDAILTDITNKKTKLVENVKKANEVRDKYAGGVDRSFIYTESYKELLNAKNSALKEIDRLQEKEDEILLDTMSNLKKFYNQKKLEAKTPGQKKSIHNEFMEKQEDLRKYFNTKGYSWDKIQEEFYKNQATESVLKKHRNGGKLLPRFQYGGLFIDNETLNFLKLNDPNYQKKQEELRAKAVRDGQALYEPRFGQTQNYADFNDSTLREQKLEEEYTPTSDSTNTSSIEDNYSSDPEGDQKTKNRRGKRDKYKQTGLESEDNGPLFSRTGINTPIGDIQYNDIAQFLLARKARNSKIADVPVALEEYQQRGSRNVLAARDMDSAMLNAAENEIAGMSSGYAGSDPVMHMIANNMSNEAKRNAKMGLVAKRAEYRRSEEDRVAREMEEKRLAQSQDLVGAMDVKNRNREKLFRAELEKAQAETKREAEYRQNLGTIFANIQTRWNTNAKQRQDARMALEAQKRDTKINTAKAERDYYLNQKTDKIFQKPEAEYRKRQEYIQSGLKGKELEKAMEKWNLDYNTSIEELDDQYVSATNTLSNESNFDIEKIMSRADQINKGDRLIRRRNK